MIKQKLTLSCDDELIKFAKDANMNISAFLEEKLAEFFNMECIFNEEIKTLWKKGKSHDPALKSEA